MVELNFCVDLENSLQNSSLTLRHAQSFGFHIFWCIFLHYDPSVRQEIKRRTDITVRQCKCKWRLLLTHSSDSHKSMQTSNWQNNSVFWTFFEIMYKNYETQWTHWTCGQNNSITAHQPGFPHSSMWCNAECVLLLEKLKQLNLWYGSAGIISLNHMCWTHSYQAFSSLQRRTLFQSESKCRSIFSENKQMIQL